LWEVVAAFGIKVIDNQPIKQNKPQQMKKLWQELRSIPAVMMFTALAILTIPGAMIAWVINLAIRGQEIDGQTVASAVIVSVACFLASGGVLVIGKILNDKNDF
jgi:hypothetical protein